MFLNERTLVGNGATSTFRAMRRDALGALKAAVEEVDPYRCVKRAILERRDQVEKFERVFLIAFGKASAKMAQAVLEEISIVDGVVVVPKGQRAPLGVKCVEGGHPIPDEGSVAAGRAILEVASKTAEDALTIVLISGGGSALVEAPLVSLQDLQRTTKLLLEAGASIEEINAVRKHLSGIKGGKLLKAIRGRVLSLIVSDVIGDPLDAIASGPTAPDGTTFSDALRVLERYGLVEEVPRAVVEALTRGAKGEMEETLKEGDPDVSRVENVVVASNADACRAMARYLEGKYKVFYFGSRVCGEAREVGKLIGGFAREIWDGRASFPKNVAIVTGGETTVTVRGNGRGGRNQELALSVAMAVSEVGAVFASMGTDGVDGPTDAAGAICDGETVKRARGLGLDPERYLERNDSYNFFRPLGDLLFTGPTGTNVADVQVLIVARGRG